MKIWQNSEFLNRDCIIKIVWAPTKNGHLLGMLYTQFFHDFFATFFQNSVVPNFLKGKILGTTHFLEMEFGANKTCATRTLN